MLSTISAGKPTARISRNAPASAWLRNNAVPYVPGKKDITRCKPVEKLEIGIYAPHKKPYPALTIVPTAKYLNNPPSGMDSASYARMKETYVETTTLLGSEFTVLES